MKLSSGLFILSIVLYGCRGSSSTSLSVVLDDSSFNYCLDSAWPRLPSSVAMTDPVSIAPDSNGDLFVFHRAGREWPLLSSIPGTTIKADPILLISGSTGEILKSWGNDVFIMPHGLSVDKQNNVWVTDVGLQQVLKFSHDGMLLLKTGERKKAGNDHSHFNMPTDVLVMDDGSFYVSDGYKNSRVVRFSASGQYMYEWGVGGSKDAQFDIPHGICKDGHNHIVVADRENNRIQFFDTTGRFIRALRTDMGKLNDVAYDHAKDQLLAVCYDGNPLSSGYSNIIAIDPNDNITLNVSLKRISRSSTGWYHCITADNKGNIFTGDILKDRLIKYSPLK